MSSEIDLPSENRRYETVRRLNPRQFSELYQRNITSDQRFDDLVDALAVDIPASRDDLRQGFSIRPSK